jgi:hypothetical protein
VSVKFLSVVSSLFFPVLLIAPTAHAAESRFVDVETYFHTTQVGRLLLPQGFQAVEESLKSQFDAACDDSFCEGFVANWTPLAFVCSVDQVDHVVGDCSWSFAGSSEEIDAETGKVTVFHESRTCDLGIQGETSALAAFLLQSSESKGYAFGLLSAKVPGREGEQTLFDVLSACL